MDVGVWHRVITMFGCGFQSLCYAVGWLCIALCCCWGIYCAYELDLVSRPPGRVFCCALKPLLTNCRWPSNKQLLCEGGPCVPWICLIMLEQCTCLYFINSYSTVAFLLLCCLVCFLRSWKLKHIEIEHIQSSTNAAMRTDSQEFMLAFKI